MTEQTLTVAACQPAIQPHDVAANVAAHCDAINKTRTRLAVFPELSLTGYELDAATLRPNDPALHSLVDACRATHTVALIGAPVHEAGHDYIAQLRVDGQGVCVAARKTWLHGPENDRFTAGQPAVTVIDGWRIGLAICFDTNIAQHASRLLDQHVDLYAASVLDVPGDQNERLARTRLTARALQAATVIARYASPTSGYPTTTGRSFITDHTGTILATTTEHPNDHVTAVLTRT